MEIWVTIDECPLLEVSNCGNVRKKEHVREVNTRYNSKAIRHDKERVLKPTDNGHGYLIVSYHDGEKRKNYYVHRLVAKAFLPGYEDGMVVDHINHDRKDNRAENLEWVSQKENVNRSIEQMHKPKSKSRPTNTGEKYISYTVINSNKNKGYRVLNRKCFKTLEEAVKYRNEVMGW